MAFHIGSEKPEVAITSVTQPKEAIPTGDLACIICGKAFDNAAILLLHLRQHIEETINAGQQALNQ